MKRKYMSMRERTLTISLYPISSNLTMALLSLPGIYPPYISSDLVIAIHILALTTNFHAVSVRNPVDLTSELSPATHVIPGSTPNVCRCP